MLAQLEPMHDAVPPQIDGADQLKHPLTSLVQVSTCVPTQRVTPALAQAFVVEHAVHAVPLQYCWLAHDAAADQARHPFESAVHVCICVPLHWVAPAVEQALVVEHALQVVPLQYC